jgi:hypothetical protein
VKIVNIKAFTGHVRIHLPAAQGNGGNSVAGEPIGVQTTIRDHDIGFLS